MAEQEKREKREKERSAGETDGAQRDRQNPDTGEHRLNLAAVYVSDAQHNRNIVFDTTPQAVRLYLLYNHWLLRVCVYVFIMMDLALALFEEPALIPLPLWTANKIAMKMYNVHDEHHEGQRS
ncbi:hypothetical protein PGIGA_G00157460 [Pangasianodon gigas]|uniref:Uncharacterized protein n=1 Tax=Pangasianodon gigas TaxID=30993 RepID=A0ACC5XS85_PANGG|nr:hypothetical protein [Pangasianodon gigas]